MQFIYTSKKLGPKKISKKSVIISDKGNQVQAPVKKNGYNI